MTNKNRPYVTCHMMTTLDGKIASGKEGIYILEDYQDLYDKTHNELKSNAWMCGRVTMEMFASGVSTPLPQNTKDIGTNDFIASYTIKKFAVSIDTKGLLRWDKNYIPFDEEDGEYHIITVVTETTPKEYLEYLQTKNISYIFAGIQELDLEKALASLQEQFSITALLLEGGGLINGAMLEAGLVDEISLLLCPQVINNSSAPALFERKTVNDLQIEKFTLTEVKQMDKNAVWLRYKK